MIRRLFERKASYEANVLAEAQALIDDGLDLEFVLGLFPEDAAWLESMLDMSSSIDAAFEGEPASYYFEASLKSKFLGHAAEPKPVVPVVVSPPTFSPFRTAIATGSVAMSAAAVGILALGFITAGDAAPGDWNYTFKLANERFQYSTSRGDSRIDVQVKQVQERFEELREMSKRGELSPTQFERAMASLDELAEQLSKQDSIDQVRKAQVAGSLRTAEAVLDDVGAKHPDFASQVAATSQRTSGLAAAVAGGPSGLTPPTSTPTASATPTAEPETPVASVTPSPGTPSETPTESPTPEETETPEPTETATTDPIEEETGTPETSATP